jgi:hypothetical protein
LDITVGIFAKLAMSYFFKGFFFISGVAVGTLLWAWIWGLIV